MYLLLSTAAPALSAPVSLEGRLPLLDRLQQWFGLVMGQSETAPDFDPNGLATGPYLDPNGLTAAPDLDPDGVAGDSTAEWDPNGFTASDGPGEAAPDMDPDG